MKFAFIAKEEGRPVSFWCRVLGVSRSGYYAWRSRGESGHAREDRRLSVLVRESHERSRQRYGSPRIHAELVARDEHVSRKRVIRLMQQEGLRGRVRRRFKCTTMSKHDRPVAANLLDRQFEAERPNHRWVSDTTELLIGDNDKAYLAAIVDLYSRYVVGWALSTANDRHLVLRALEMATRLRCPDAGLLLHSDRGSTYASEDYQKLLEDHGITCSMSRRGDCFDNAPMESWFSTFKFEVGERFESYSEAKQRTFDYVELFYNQHRRHSSLGYLSPAEFERRHREQGGQEGRS